MDCVKLKTAQIDFSKVEPILIKKYWTWTELARQAARQLLKSPYVLVGIQKEIRRCIKEHGEAISPFWLLSVKHRHFCLNYISSYYLNVTEAAIKTGYNKRNARRIGSRLYKNKAIQAGIRDLEDYMHMGMWNIKKQTSYDLDSDRNISKQITEKKRGLQINIYIGV